MTIAILCSGQGRQHAEMFALTGDAPEAGSLFAHAATLLGGRDPREVVRTETSGFYTTIASVKFFARCRPWQGRPRFEMRCPTGSSLQAIASVRSRRGVSRVSST